MPDGEIHLSILPFHLKALAMPSISVSTTERARSEPGETAIPPVPRRRSLLALIAIPACTAAAEDEVTFFPQARAQRVAGVGGGQTDDGNGHHGAVENHEEDLVVGNGTAEAVGQLGDSEAAAD